VEKNGTGKGGEKERPEGKAVAAAVRKSDRAA